MSLIVKYLFNKFLNSSVKYLFNKFFNSSVLYYTTVALRNFRTFRNSVPYDISFRFTGTETEVINMGSYNYLGFSHNDGPCAEEALQFIDKYGLHIGGTRHERGV